MVWKNTVELTITLLPMVNRGMVKLLPKFWMKLLGRISLATDEGPLNEVAVQAERVLSATIKILREK
jgi:hypothetical protein